MLLGISSAGGKQEAGENFSLPIFCSFLPLPQLTATLHFICPDDRVPMDIVVSKPRVELRRFAT